MAGPSAEVVPSSWPDGIHPDLIEVKRALYDPLGFACSIPIPHGENVDYGAYAFTVGGRAVISRVAKLTPRKIGLFVAVWDRSDDGSTRPLRAEDGMDFLVVSTREGANFGQFVFSLEGLVAHGIVSTSGEGGKRGFRVYPPWSLMSNAQAQRTQKWQSQYFVPIDGTPGLDLGAARVRYGIR